MMTDAKYIKMTFNHLNIFSGCSFIIGLEVSNQQSLTTMVTCT
uniref:Uncharacterized protein n=1 Tax=Anguilla anguilla TaxID=7936 RepID=A0A0E9U9U9_ANGAN